MDKIICVGKNYLEHAKELGDAIPAKPVLFLKPPSVLKVAVTGDTTTAVLPTGVGSVHHECEIVLRLDRGGYRMSREEGRAAIGAVTLGLDLTLRDRQAELKKAGHPWTTSKVFPDSAIIGPWIPVRKFSDYLDVEFTFTLQEKVRQRGRGHDMLLSPEACVAYASEFFPLCSGDLLFTGTPAGVGPIGVDQTALLSWGNMSYSVRWKSDASN